MISAFNVCHSKDVFVFSRKISSSLERKNKVVSGRRCWNSQEKVGVNAEVFLPSAPKKHYRILPKSSHGKR